MARPAKIREVLLSSDGIVLEMFSKRGGSLESNDVKVYAILEALSILMAHLAVVYSMKVIHRVNEKVYDMFGIIYVLIFCFYSKHLFFENMCFWNKTKKIMFGSNK